MTTPPIVHQYHAPQNTRVLVDRDEEQLRLLAIFHFAVGGLNLLALVLFVLAPLVMGAGYYAMLRVPLPLGSMAEMQPRLINALIIGGSQILIFGLNGWFLKKHQNRISCMILSVVECLSIPLGLILGVSAILVLRRDSTKALFQQEKILITPQE
jgi:hypothetical protein